MKLLLLGGSFQQIIAIETAKEIGLKTVLCDYLIDNPGQYYADKFYLESTTDKDAILQIAKKENIDGIIAYASDPAAPTAAYVAEHLNLSGNSYKSVSILCDKSRFRSFLKKNQFSVPNSIIMHDGEYNMKLVMNLRLPLIVKPTDSSGSKGVTVLTSYSGIEESIAKALIFSRNKKIIIEEYIENKYQYLFGGDIFIVDGEIVQWGLMDCIRDPRANTLVPSGKKYPCSANDKDLINIQDELSRLVHLLQLKQGALNVEIIVDNNDNIFIIDAGPRNGGNYIPQMLEFIFQENIIKKTILQSVGENVSIRNQYDGKYYASYNIHSNSGGLFKSVEFSEIIKPFILAKYINKNEGDKVDAFNNSADAIGVILMKCDDENTMDKIIYNIEEHIKVLLEE